MGVTDQFFLGYDMPPSAGSWRLTCPGVPQGTQQEGHPSGQLSKAKQTTFARDRKHRRHHVDGDCGCVSARRLGQQDDATLEAMEKAGRSTQNRKWFAGTAPTQEQKTARSRAPQD
jgi:hypothetical protein